jgi:phage-related protein
MPLDVVPFIAEKNKRWGEAFVMLVEIQYAAGVFWRVAKLGLTEESIEFEGETWTNFPIDIPRRSKNSRAEIPTFDLSVANPERVFQSILHNYVVEGRTGRLITVHRDHIDDPTAKIEERFTIESATSTARVVTVTCRAIRFNPRRSRIPSRTMTRAEYPGLLGPGQRRFF